MAEQQRSDAERGGRGAAAERGAGAPGRAVVGGRLAVVTPWYPSEQRPFAGSFVRALTGAVDGLFDELQVLNTEDWPGPRGPVRHDLVRSAHRRLVGAAAVGGGPGPRVPLRPVPLGPGTELLRVPVPVRAARDYADWGRLHEEVLREALPTGRIEADVVHGHVGTYGGWMACRLARPGARIVVTEHASFLHRVLRQAPAKEMYGQVLERADEVLCVSEVLRDRLLSSFPQWAEKVRVVPNVVDVSGTAMRPDRVTRLDRWLFLGHLAADKGVPELLGALALAAEERPEVSLTLVGWGLHTEELVRERAERIGVAERVTVLPPQPPREVPGLLRSHDLLVHPSKYETFGMTVVEALAVGTPVLVTRCGGPEETMAGLVPAGGALVEVSDDPAVIADGWRELAGRLDELDPERARGVVERRYGRDAVRAELARAYGVVDRPRPGAVAARAGAAGGPAAASEGSGPVVFLSVGGNRPLGLGRDVRRAREDGRRVEVFALDAAVREQAELDPAVPVHAVGGLPDGLVRRVPTGRGRRLVGGGADAVRTRRLGRLVCRLAPRGAELVPADAHAFAVLWTIARHRPDLRLRVPHGAEAAAADPRAEEAVEAEAEAAVEAEVAQVTETAETAEVTGAADAAGAVGVTEAVDAAEAVEPAGEFEEVEEFEAVDVATAAEVTGAVGAGEAVSAVGSETAVPEGAEHG